MKRSITKRIDAITQISPKFWSAHLPAPASVKIELTSQCNYRCGFCAHRLRLKDRGEMDRELYSRLVKEMRQAGVEELGLFYIGESFMCQWLPEAIREAKRTAFPYVFLTTNGSLCSENRIRDCMLAGLDSLKFSINFDSEAQFEDITGVKPKLYHQALHNLKLARLIRDAGKFDCGIYASSIAFDGEQQKRMEALVTRSVLPYVDEHYWLPLYSMGSLAEERERELGYRPTAGNQGRIGALREPLPCWSAFTEGHICHDGKLSACCFDAGDRWTMADLTEVSFMEGWNSERFQELRAAHLEKDVTGTPCEQCVAYGG